MGRITPEQAKRRQELTEKLRMRVLTINEAEELRQLLEMEKNQATSLGDVIGALAVLVLIGLVIDYLSGDKR